MEAFALLTRGVSNTDKKKYKEQSKIFSAQYQASTQASSSKPKALANGLPPELDFFKYAQSDKAGIKSDKAKGKQPEVVVDVVEADDDDMDDGQSDNENQPPYSRPPPIKASNKKGTLHRIAATGSKVPKVAGDFSILQNRYGVSQQLLDNLAGNGFAHPTAIQSQAIPVLLEKRDLAGISPTGTGKTLAFTLPMFALLGEPSVAKAMAEESTGPRALIIVPTRELADQIHNECLKLAQGRKWNVVLFSKKGNSAETAAGKIDVVIGTPLRLIAALRENSMPLNNIRYLVLDEADHLLGPEFHDQTQEIIEGCTHPDLQKCMFSATLPAAAETVAKRLLNDPVRVVVGSKDAASLHVSQSLVYAGSETGKLFALRNLLATNPPLPMLVFVESKERAKELYQELLYDNLTVDQLHSDMTAKQRLESVTRLRKGETWVMVCTEVMARGMDFGGIRGIVNYDFPTTLQSYVHRIGRTGRAGRHGVAITYFTDKDLPYLRPVAKMIHQIHLQQTAFSEAAESNMDAATRAAIVAPTTPIPKWMLDLPRPDSRVRKRLKYAGMGREGVTEVAGGQLGKKDAIRKRELAGAAKRQKETGKLGKPSNPKKANKGGPARKGQKQKA